MGLIQYLKEKNEKRRREKLKKNELEGKIYRFIWRANKLVNSDLKKGYRFLRMANTLYCKFGYDENINPQITNTLWKYIDLIFPNPLQ